MNKKLELQLLLRPDHIIIYDCEIKQAKILSLLDSYKYAVKIEIKYNNIKITGENKYLYSCLKELTEFYILEII